MLKSTFSTIFLHKFIFLHFSTLFYTFPRCTNIVPFLLYFSIFLLTFQDHFVKNIYKNNSLSIQLLVVILQAKLQNKIIY